MKFFILFLLLCFNGTYAQLGLKLGYAQPTEDLGFNVKPAVTYAITFKNVNGRKRFMPRLDIGYTKFKPRLDTFPIYNIGTLQNKRALFPGVMAADDITLFYIHPGFDLKLAVNDSMHMYVGFDLNFGKARSALYEYVPMYSSRPVISSYDAFYYGGGFRLGFEYVFRKKITFWLEGKRNYNQILDGGTLFYNDYALGARFRLFKR